jgi:CHAT domain-containing protein
MSLLGKRIAVIPLLARSKASTVVLLFAVALRCVTSGAETQPQSFVEEGQRLFEKGQFSEAAVQWQRATDLFRKQGNTNAEIKAACSLAAALQCNSQHRHAVEILRETLERAEATHDQSSVTLVKSKLGAALILTPEFHSGRVLLEEALKSARAGGNTALTAAILNDLGNALSAEGEYADALKAYEESWTAAEQTGNALLTAQALCNGATSLARSGETEKADHLNARALDRIERLPASHDKAFLLLTAGQTDGRIQSTGTNVSEQIKLRAHRSFQEAQAIASEQKDRVLETYALGYLGEMYERDGQLDAARQLTRRAIFTAQEAQRPEALYRWEWQSGRLFKKQGDSDASIAAYRRALQTLQSIRSDLSAGYGNRGGYQTFRESEGPLFYELADLLLIEAKATIDPKKEQELLLEARDTVESLKTVELQDYFCDECVDLQRLKRRIVESVDPHSAVVYVIPLPDRTELLVGLVSGLKRFTVPASASELTAQVREFRRNLETRTTFAYLAQARQLYDWLIRPIRGTLKEGGIDTLVFVPDGALRTIPFAALNDGERFLIQDLAVAVVPGLSLVDPQAIRRGNAKFLLSGISKSVQGFAPLEFVTNELSGIQQMYKGETLLNEHFTTAELGNKLRDQQFSVVHIASHGQFDRDVRKTFVLTYDNKLTLDNLEALIRPSQYRGRPVEMLVLSACQTAAGDDRAALGLAGVAIKAGARSALASLWFVNDQSTSAMTTEFYRQLEQSSVSKAHALQAAQIKLLSDRRYRHPCYWSPYLIIGNWL